MPQKSDLARCSEVGSPFPNGKVWEQWSTIISAPSLVLKGGWIFKSLKSRRYSWKLLRRKARREMQQDAVWLDTCRSTTDDIKGFS
jgi:hypothetical protein